MSLAAAAAHLESSEAARAAAMIASVHAVAMLAAAGVWAAGLRLFGFRLAIAVVAVGAALFCGDVALGVFLEASLFPMAAPIGGSAVILGWLGVALVGGVAALRRATRM